MATWAIPHFFTSLNNICGSGDLQNRCGQRQQPQRSYLLCIVNGVLVTVFQKTLWRCVSHCSSYCSVLRKDDYSLYLNDWIKMKAKLAPAINQVALSESKQMQLREKLVRRQFSWDQHLQSGMVFSVTPGHPELDLQHSLLKHVYLLSSEGVCHDKLLQHLWCKKNVPKAYRETSNELIFAYHNMNISFQR